LKPFQEQKLLLFSSINNLRDKRKRSPTNIVLGQLYYLSFSSIAYVMLLVFNLGPLLLLLDLPLPTADCHQVAQTRRFLEPCETMNQSYCSSDDEDYETQDECDVIQVDNCNKSLELYCIDGFCEANCNSLLEYYDDIQGKCFRKIGQPCKSSLNCDKNAECDKRTKTCLCSPNYSVDIETGRRCVLSSEFGEYCDSEITCDILSDITCQSNRCDCRSPGSQFYHLGRRRCYIYVGYECSGGLRFCPDNSECLREFTKEDMLPGGVQPEDEHYLGISFDFHDTSKVFKCKCNSGYGRTLDGKMCLGLYGTSCSSKHRCNTERSLKCYDGTCQCAKPLSQRYDSEREKCVNLVGSVCKTGNNNDGAHQTSAGCVDWAECIRNESLGISNCKCVPGYLPSPLGTCLKGYGESCVPEFFSSSSSSSLLDQNRGIKTADDDDDEPPCNIYVGLECSNLTETCQCKHSDQYFDVKLEVCRDFHIVPNSEHIPNNEHFDDDLSDREYNFHKKKSQASFSTSHKAGSIFIMLALSSLQRL